MKKALLEISIRLAFFINIAVALLLIGFIVSNGIKKITIEFLFSMPKDGMTAGGILPAIVGTFMLTTMSMIFAIPIGLITAIYLNEYLKKGKIYAIIKVSINTLAGVPSIVFGLFGLAFFVKFLGLGISALSGALTLAILILPLFISTTQEALSSVPDSLREASMAMGATKLYTIRKVVIPAALPSILTGIILSIGRVAGETAPILFTAAVFYQKDISLSPLAPVMALPYHIYALMTEGTDPEKHTAIAYGTALVLISLVLFLVSYATILREKRRRYVKD